MKIKLNLKLLNKLTAILVVGCFFVSSVCRDAIAAAATPTMNAQEFKQIFTDFMLPYSYGKISGSHFAGTDRVVINIQDLHCHPQVQKSINDIIEMFDNKYGVSNVYLEGACGDISAKPFLKNLTNITEKNEILDKLLQSGRLTGAEYYSATTNKTEIIKGLEKKDPYLENLKRFGNLLEVQDQIASILKGVEESTQKVKKQYYTRRQYKIEKLSKDYLEGKIKAEKYYRLLAKHTEKLGIDLTKYENTFLYMQLLALQSELDYKAITKQLQTLVFLLKENLPPNAYQILLDNTKNFEQTDKLYAYIIKLSKSFGLDLDVNFKELDKYFNFIELSQKINPLELLKEEENLTREINTRFSDTIAQREVVFLTNFEKYLKDYLSTKITSDDYEYYKENIETYKKLWNKYVDNKVLTLLEPYMKETDKFYKINTDRNNYFTENIFNGVETEKIENIKEEPDEVSKIIENMDKVKRVDIIITGGFHSQTVSEILKQHGISYIVITPNVQDGVKEAEKTYYQIAKQQREINFQTLAARIVLDLFGDENLSQIARIKVLKDYNLSKQEVRDIIGTNVENSLLEDIFSLTDEEFIKKYNPRYDNDLQDVFDNTSVVNGLINVAEQLESDDISPANFKKLTEIIAKEYGISNEQEIEQIAQKAVKIIENGENSSILDAFTNIFKSGNQDVVLTILEVYNNYNPKTVDYFLDDKENKFEYDKEKGLYKFKNDKKIYLKDYKIVDEVPMESSKESKKLEQQEISTERKFYKEMEEKIENFDFSLNRPNRNIVEENIKNLNVIIDEISISELLNDEERISLTKKLEDKVVDLIYPKDNKKEGLNILRKSTKNALIPGNVITTSMFVKDILESKLSDEVKFEIIEGVDVNDIEDNRTKNKVLEIKEQIEKGKAVLETGLEEKAKENLRLNLQNLEAKEEQYLRDKEEQLRLEKEKEDLEKSSQKNIDKTNKEKQTSSLLELVTPQFSSKGAAALGAEEKQIENLSRLMDSTIFTIYDNIKYFFKFDLKYNSIREQIQQMIQDGEIEILNFNTINDFSFKYDGKTWIISEDKTLVEVPMAGQGLKMVRTKEEMLKEWHRNKISEEIGPTFNSLISEKAQNKLVQLSIDGKLTKEIIENFNEFIRSSILNGRSKIYYDKEKDDFYYEENNKPKKDRKKIYFETFVQEQNEQKNQKKALRIKAKKILDGYGFKFEEEEIDRIAEVFALVGESIFDELINEYSSIYIKNVCDIIIDDDVENIVWILNFFIGKYSRRDKKNIFLNLFENSEKSKKVCKSLWDAAKNIDNVGNFDDFIKKMNLMTSAMTPDQFSKFLNIILEADEETNKNLFDLLSRAGSTFKEYFLNLGWEQNDLNKFLIRFGMLGDEEKEIILKSNTQRSESFINVLTRLDDNEFKKIQNLFEIILHKFEYDNVYGFFVLKIFCNKNFIEKFEKHPIFKDLNDKDKTIQIYKRAGAFWLFLKELNENEELRNYLGLEYYIDLNELLEEENSETLNNLMNEFFNIYNDLEKTKIYRKNMKVIGVAHTEEGEPGFNGRRFMFNSIKKVNDLLGLNLNYHGTLFKLGYCGDPDIISIDDPIDLKEQLSQSIKENINAKEGLLIAFTGHGSVDGLWLSGSDDNNKNLGPNANKITPDEFVKMFCDKNGNPLEKDLSNVVINLGSCHSYYYAKNLIEEFRKAGFEKMPIIISAAGQETVFGYTVFETDENGIATSGRADNFDEGLINYWREYNLKGELTAKDILLAESYIRNSNSSLFVSNENNLNAYEKVVNILSKNDSIKKQTNYAEKADYQTSKQNVSDYTFKDATVMLSIFNTIKKHLENKDWNNEKGIRKFIFKAVSFLDKTAPIWEELVFRAIPMIMSPGIFIVSQIIFILLHFKELNTKEKLTVTALTIGLSSIYVGMSICFPGTLPLAYTIAMIIHAINNKYGPVKLSILKKFVDTIKGNNKTEKNQENNETNFDKANIYDDVNHFYEQDYFKKITPHIIPKSKETNDDTKKAAENFRAKEKNMMNEFIAKKANDFENGNYEENENKYNYMYIYYLYNKCNENRNIDNNKYKYYENKIKDYIKDENNELYHRLFAVMYLKMLNGNIKLDCIEDIKNDFKLEINSDKYWEKLKNNFDLRAFITGIMLLSEKDLFNLIKYQAENEILNIENFFGDREISDNSINKRYINEKEKFDNPENFAIENIENIYSLISQAIFTHDIQKQAMSDLRVSLLFIRGKQEKGFDLKYVARHELIHILVDEIGFRSINEIGDSVDELFAHVKEGVSKSKRSREFIDKDYSFFSFSEEHIFSLNFIDIFDTILEEVLDTVGYVSGIKLSTAIAKAMFEKSNDELLSLSSMLNHSRVNDPYNVSQIDLRNEIFNVYLEDKSNDFITEFETKVNEFDEGWQSVLYNLFQYLQKEEPSRYDSLIKQISNEITDRNGEINIVGDSYSSNYTNELKEKLENHNPQTILYHVILSGNEPNKKILDVISKILLPEEKDLQDFINKELKNYENKDKFKKNIQKYKTNKKLKNILFKKTYEYNKGNNKVDNIPTNINAEESGTSVVAAFAPTDMSMGIEIDNLKNLPKESDILAGETSSNDTKEKVTDTTVVSSLFQGHEQTNEDKFDQYGSEQKKSPEKFPRKSFSSGYGDYLKYAINPMELIKTAENKITNYLEEKRIIKELNGNKYVLVKKGIATIETGVENARYYDMRENSNGLRNLPHIKIGEIEGVEIRLAINADNEFIFYSNTTNINNIDGIDAKIEELMDKFTKDGIKTNLISENTIIAFAYNNNGKITIEDISRSIRAKQTDYVMHGISSIHSFGNEEITLNKCKNISEFYGITTFSVNKQIYNNNLSEIEKIKNQGYNVIVEETNVNELIINENQTECILDFSEIECDLAKLKSIREQILEQYGINVTVYIKLSEETLETLKNDDIFEKTGIIPMVNAEYLKNGLTVNGKKGLYNINSERQVKEQTDVVCVIFDKDSEEKLNKELSKKGLFNGVRNIIEQITNIDSPKNKFEDGKDKALSSEKYKLNFEEKSIDEAVRDLKSLLEIDVTKENVEIKKQFNNLNLSELLSEDALEYIQTRYISKDNYIEALGFILGVVENSIVDEMINEMFKDKNVDIDKIRKDMRTNEMQGVLRFAIYLMLQDKFENKNIIEMLFNPKDIDVNMSAQELYESKKAELLELNKVLDLFLRKGFSVTEKEIKEGTRKNLSDIIEDVNNIIPIIWEDRYGSSTGVVEASTIAMDAFRSMLAAA